MHEPHDGDEAAKVKASGRRIESYIDPARVLHQVFGGTLSGVLEQVAITVLGQKVAHVVERYPPEPLGQVKSAYRVHTANGHAQECSVRLRAPLHGTRI